MRHLFIIGAALAALGINVGNAEAAFAPLEGLTTFQQLMSVTIVGSRRPTILPRSASILHLPSLLQPRRDS